MATGTWVAFSAMARRRLQVPNNLRSLRTARGLTQAQLAERLGVDASTVSRWEKRLQAIGDHHKRQAAHVFDVTPGQLMRWDAPADPDPATELRDAVA